MILKGLKILPLLLGSATSKPILEQPKRADNPITYEYNKTMFLYDSVNDITQRTNYRQQQWQIEGTPQQWQNEYAKYQQGFYNQTLYFINQQGIQNTRLYGGAEGGTTPRKQYKPMAMTTLSITNTRGLQTINLENKIQISLYSILDLQQDEQYTINYTLEILVSSNDNDWNYQFWDIDQDQTLGNIINEIENTYTIQTIKTENGTLTATMTTTEFDLQHEVENYILHASQNYYFFFICKLQLPDNPLCHNSDLATNTKQVIKPYDDGDIQPLYIQQEMHSEYAIQEVIDVPDVMFTILTMPFSFISQAFNITLFPGTQYALNISQLFLALIAVLIFALIMKIIIGRFM